MYRKALFPFCVMVLLAMSAWAQGPNASGTYYRAADGKSGEALKTALYNIIKDPSVTSYAGLRDAYKKTDTRADGYLRDWYSNISNYVPGSGFSSGTSEGQGYNREHTVPQSWFGEASPMKSDIVHVVPTDAAINNMRSNFPFGEVNPNASNYKESKNGYSKYGSSRTTGYNGIVFEPNDEIKGDIARIYFYMATCYEDKITGWTSGTGSIVIGGTCYQPYKKWVFDMLMQWSKQDPVDDVETARNKAAYGVQKNRNPYVDYPGLEEYVWGDKTTVAFSYDNYGNDGEMAQRVATPVFSPGGGQYADSVEVTITSETAGATVYYTLNGDDASDGGLVYDGPITLRENTVLKAIAVCDAMTASSQATATYTIKHSGDPLAGTEVELALNNSLFGTNYSGPMQNTPEDLTGTSDGITVVYALGEGSNRYCNNSQIRLYQKNTLTISSADGRMQKMEFVLNGQNSKTLRSSSGTLSGLVWTGDESTVTFTVNDGAGNMPLSAVLVTLKVAAVKGDVNGDGIVDVADIAAILCVMAQTAQYAAADVNGDSVVDVADVAATLDIMAGTE